MANDVELMCAYWTSAGPVEVHFGREWSLYSLDERCAQAAGAGYIGVGLWHADLTHMLDGGQSFDGMKKVLDDHGLICGELEFIADFFLNPGEEGRKASDDTRRLLFDAAAALDAHHIKVGNIPGTPCEIPQITERYGELCEDAASQTDAQILYEFMPFDVNVDSIEKAMQVVQGAGARNGGVVIDTWHMAKLDIKPDDLRQIPLEYLSWIELSDGQYEYMEDRLDEVINRRKLPGEGEFDIRGYIAAASDHGYAGPWGVEVLSEDLRALPIEEMYRSSYEAAASQFQAVTA